MIFIGRIYVICDKYEFLPLPFFVVKYLNLTVNLKDWPLVFST